MDLGCPRTELAACYLWQLGLGRLESTSHGGEVGAGCMGQAYAVYLTCKTRSESACLPIVVLLFRTKKPSALFKYAFILSDFPTGGSRKGLVRETHSKPEWMNWGLLMSWSPEGKGDRECPGDGLALSFEGHLS